MESFIIFIWGFFACVVLNLTVDYYVLRNKVKKMIEYTELKTNSKGEIDPDKLQKPKNQWGK